MDYLYLILVLPAVIFSLWASIRVNTTFKKYSKIRSMRGITGAEAARRVLDANGLQHIRIEQIPGNLTDHYDPRSDTEIPLSPLSALPAMKRGMRFSMRKIMRR